jgi:antitoxin component of MazEF toxin-antitoxin module
VKVRRVGNSLTVTIPKEIAVDLGIAPSMEMELSVKDGTLVMEPAEDRWLRLLAEIQKHAADRGLTEADIETAIREYREQWS